MKLKAYAYIKSHVNVYDENGNLLYQKIECAFEDEYNEEHDSTPIRKLKIRKDRKGEYVMHNHERYYID